MRGLLLPIGSATVVAAALAHVAALWVGIPPPNLVQSYSVLAFAALLSMGFASLLGYIAWLAWQREADPIPRVKALVARGLAPAFLGSRIAPMFLTFAFLGSFSALKVLIPNIHPFAFDGAFSDLDRVLFGTDPWRITHAMIGPAGTRMIGLIYGLWLPVFGLAVFGFSLLAPQELKRRFFLSFFAIWALMGLGLATLLSSAGPCFLDLIQHPYSARYADLFPLQNAPGARHAQAYLAEGYKAGGFAIARGISAMPSIHVAIAALYVLAARHLGRPALAAAIVFYVLVAIGSVHLGWHYAVDGIVGTLGAMLIWWVLKSRPVAPAG